MRPFARPIRWSGRGSHTTKCFRAPSASATENQEPYMPKPNLKIAGEAPPRTPERIALAEAIERHADAVRMLDANKCAQEATTQTRRQAQDAVERSVAMIEEAKTNAATHLTEVAMGTAGE